MFRIKQTIQIPKTNKKIKMYLKDTYGAILYFKTKQEAKEQINFILYFLSVNRHFWT